MYHSKNSKVVNGIREILERAQPPEKHVSSDLLPLVYEELKNLASLYMAREAPGHTLQATALVHEAWLTLSKHDLSLWNNREHFFRAASQAMRHILVDRARAKGRQKRGGRVENLSIHDIDLAEATMDERVLLVDEVMTELEKEDPVSARIISLKFFGGLKNKEIAAMDGVGERTIDRQWAYAKARLFQMLCEENISK